MIVPFRPFVECGQARNLTGDRMGADFVFRQIGNKVLGIDRLAFAPVKALFGQPGDPDVQIAVVAVASRLGVTLGKL